MKILGIDSLLNEHPFQQIQPEKECTEKKEAVVADGKRAKCDDYRCNIVFKHGILILPIDDYGNLKILFPLYTPFSALDNCIM
jgi:hypothetical protein